MRPVASAYGDEMRRFAGDALRFDTTDGNEAPFQEWFESVLEGLGFETYAWETDRDDLEALPEFDAATDPDVEGRPNVGGVLELGDPEAGPALVLNGHADVVPVDGDWSGNPFEPRWEGDRLVARGAADMKANLAACVFAARHLADEATDLDGRIVVESVAGEEEGGFGAATAAQSNPYPFERDAALVAEPTDVRLVTATEGCLMMRLRVPGRPAHAARRWQGVDPLDRFEAIRERFRDLEAERASEATHPLYERFENPCPLVIGNVNAGVWASNVPADLLAEMRIGVLPDETLDSVESQFRQCLEDVVADDEWLREHPPAFERFGVQFEPAEVDPDEPIVDAVGVALSERGHDAAPAGETYGADSRHYLRAGIPTVVFGAGRIEEAHFPDESIFWPDVLEAAEVIANGARRFLSG